MVHCRASWCMVPGLYGCGSAWVVRYCVEVQGFAVMGISGSVWQGRGSAVCCV